MRPSVLALLILALIACSRSTAPRPPSAAASASPAVATVPRDDGAATTAPTGPIQPVRPTLDREPAVGVLLAQGPSVTFTLPGRATLVVDGRAESLGPGPVTATATSNGLRVDRLPGRPVGDHLLFQTAPGGFSADAIGPDGRSVPLILAGLPEVHLDPASRKAQLVERIAMDRYLPGVLTKEMSPKWPVEALKAQAIVARSYAADRFLQNWQRPWQVHWHSSVDMAYAGSAPDHGRAGEAVRATAGELIMYRGQPVPALFHACSGGRTSRVLDLKPDLTLADGVSDPSLAMAPIDDPAAKEGAQGLNLTRTHWQWTVTVPLAEVAADLKRWFATRAGDMSGEITAVRIARRDGDGARVLQVAITHRRGGQPATLTMPGNDFRLAVGPGQVRSLWWTSCEIRRGNLVIAGRGYGHGVGLSQVSAWHLARTGVAAEDIVRRFYPGATLERKW